MGQESGQTPGTHHREDGSGELGEACTARMSGREKCAGFYGCFSL